MRAVIAICDICRTGGEGAQLAEIHYQNHVGSRFHACGPCAKLVMQSADSTIIETYDIPGDPEEAALM